jgi:hypothetical protein
VAAGIIRQGSGGLRRVLATPPIAAPEADLQGALDEERGNRVDLVLDRRLADAAAREGLDVLTED